MSAQAFTARIREEQIDDDAGLDIREIGPSSRSTARTGSMPLGSGRRELVLDRRLE